MQVVSLERMERPYGRVLLVSCLTALGQNVQVNATDLVQWAVTCLSICPHFVFTDLVSPEHLIGVCTPYAPLTSALPWAQQCLFSTASGPNT
jgi:hypothetical protein